MQETNSLPPAGSDGDSHLVFKSVAGFFLQDSRDTDPGTFDAMAMNFGLIDQAFDTDELLPNNGKDLTTWQRFNHKLMTMNKEAPQGFSYRLLYLGRHGQGQHNVGEMFYGTEAWNCHHSLLDHDTKSPEVVFFDAHLTKAGQQQARDLSAFWLQLIQKQHIPQPQTYYVSPLTRTAQTANLTFEALQPYLPSSAPYYPVVKELLRECHGIHSCDRRPTKSYLQAAFPNLIFEESEQFAEEDELWSPTLRETPHAHSARLTALLQNVLSHDDSTYISMTAHSGTISALLRAVGHRSFALPTGGAIPVLIETQTVSGKGPSFDRFDKTNWEHKPDCISDPSQAGKKGYENIGDFLKDIESSVP